MPGGWSPPPGRALTLGRTACSALFREGVILVACMHGCVRTADGLCSNALVAYVHRFVVAAEETQRLEAKRQDGSTRFDSLASPGVGTGAMEFLVDADGHVLEPPDLWERYVDPEYRDRAIRVRRRQDGRDMLEIDGRPARLTTPEMLGGIGGMGMGLEELAEAATSGRYLAYAPQAAYDPGARIRRLDAEGLTHAILYPTLGLQWEAEVSDAGYALAHCRAYNRWIEDFCRDTGGRLIPIAHLSLGDAHAAAQELRRAVANGARGGFVLPFTLDGLPHGHPDHDPLWRAAEELDVPIAIHTGVDPPRVAYTTASTVFRGLRLFQGKSGTCNCCFLRQSSKRFPRFFSLPRSTVFRA